MRQIYCVANQKGGVGKTTTAISLASAIARSGRRTLLVDLDPQCNATSGLGLDPTPRHPLVTGQGIAEAVVPTTTKNLEVLPGCGRFSDVEMMAVGNRDLLVRMAEWLTEGVTDYETVLIDTPPSLGPMTRAALAWSTEVIMPIQCEYFAMEGLRRMIEVIRNIKQNQKGALSFAGILLTMYDPELELTLEVDKDVRGVFREFVYETVIPRDVAFSEASSHGRSIFEYDPRSRGVRAYAELCLEVLEHV
ncbi:MAG: ParA family protein [Thermoguttaceae bacterium]|jgi:chromosome partitioning protein